MKRIIERKLPLNTKYSLVDKKYIPLIEGIGTCCDNCGQLIANMATVKNEAGQSYTIGFDCLETFLINNSLLSTGDVVAYEAAKKMLPKILRFSKTIKDTIERNRSINITGIRFEKDTYPSEFYPFYWLKNDQVTSRDNDYVKLKDVDMIFVIETLKNIFPKLTFLYN